MKYGISIPNFGDELSVQVLADFASVAEAAGWDGFFLWDHVVAYFLDQVPVIDPWIALTAIAIRTARIRFGPLVTPLPRRRPTKVARETASLDQLSGGRLVLGVGIGAMPYEWDYLGEESDPKVRGAMLDEGLEVLAGLWSGEPFAFQGKHYRVGSGPPDDWRPTFSPPVPRPRIPIWVAGTWPLKAPFRRAACWDGVCPMKADGWLLPDEVRDLQAEIAMHRSSDGPFDVVILGSTPGDDAAAAADVVADYAAAGANWWVEVLNSGPADEVNARIRMGPPAG